MNNKVFGFKIRSGLIFSIFSTLLVVLAIVYSFMIMGSPMKQRDLRLDDRRVSDLQNIQYQVINYWQQKEELPKDLATLANPLTGFSLPVDPEFEKGNSYEYFVKDYWFSYPERVKRQDDICCLIKDYIQKYCPHAGSVYVWLQLSELGHSSKD